MKWFKHYTNAHNDNSMQKVRMKYGAEGYAVYWYCLELIAGDLGQDGKNINFELSHDAQVVAFNLRIDTLKVEEIMLYLVELGLFENVNNTITCMKLAKFLDKKVTRNKEIHEIIDSYKEMRNVPDSLPTVTELSTLDKNRIDKNYICANAQSEYKDKFDRFWQQYPKKKDKAKALKAFLNLKPEDELFSKIISALTIQKQSADWLEDDGRFIPYPTTWLNGHRWEDESDDFTNSDEGYQNYV